MSIIVLDTMVVIWGIQGWSKPEQQDMIIRARVALEKISNSKDQIAISAITLAEVLSGVKEGDRKGFKELVEDSLIVLPFDGLAALEYSKIWNKKTRDRVRSRTKNKEQLTRSQMKADTMIVASAISRNAKFIYSEDDGDLTACADGYIEVKTLPIVEEQQKFNFK